MDTAVQEMTDQQLREALTDARHSIIGRHVGVTTEWMIYDDDHYPGWAVRLDLYVTRFQVTRLEVIPRSAGTGPMRSAIRHLFIDAAKQLELRDALSGRVNQRITL